MELLDGEDGVLEQIEYEEVDDGIWEPYVLFFDHPPSPGSQGHREALLPYVMALVWAFSQAPYDIGF